MKKICIFFLILLSGFYLSCTKKASKDQSQIAQPASEQVLYLRLHGEPSLLNPILSTDAYSSSVEGMIFNGLFRVNESLELEPDLVSSYNISADGKIYTFHLKKNVKWHDGHPFTAADVKFTFEKILDPKTNTVRRSSYMIDDKPIVFQQVDKYQIKAILPKPFAPFLSRISMSIIPKHILENQDINTAAFNRQPIGTGPFQFQDWQTGQHIVVKRNDHYFEKNAALEKIVFKMIPDSNTATIALEKGEIDSSDILAKDMSYIKKHSHLKIYNYEQLLYSYMGFNLKHPLLKQKIIRQAIAHAINKNAIVKAVYKGYALPAYYPSSPVSWAFPSGARSPYPYQPEKSRVLLESLGYQLNPKTKVYEKDGGPLQFTLMLGKGSKTGEKSAQIIQRFLADVGIKLNIQLMEWQAFIRQLQAPKDPKEFDMVMLSWSLGLDPDGYSIWHSSQYPNGFNFIGYKNKKVDQLLIDGRLTTQKEKRKVIYQSIFSEIASDVPYIFLVYPESITGINNRVGGLSKPGPAGLFNKIEEVNIKY